MATDKSVNGVIWAVDAHGAGSRCPRRGESMLTARGVDAHGAGIMTKVSAGSIVTFDSSAFVMSKENMRAKKSYTA